ncbi:MAG: hypothetical protein O9327_02010 [Polaromonas sp.]|nr:hypothetical protein [Polaromonas sp.]
MNAGKDEVVMRPHFRHGVGFDRQGCAVHSARLAVLATLTKTGWIDLPGRRIPAQAIGLSGQAYVAPELRPRQRLRVVDLNLSDRTRALLTLEDGRELVVVLVGEPGGADPGRAVLSLELPDEEVEKVLLDPESVWDRLALIPDLVCWQSDWKETELQKEASDAAHALAVEHIDAYANDQEAALCSALGLAGSEGLLHLLTKQVIQEESRLFVPEPGMNAAHADRFREGGWLAFCSVRPEEYQPGRFVPDLVATVCADEKHPASNLFIEVIVTHGIDDIKRDRLLSSGVPTLSIDFREAGGRVTRSTLRQLVIQDVSLKSWLEMSWFMRPWDPSNQVWLHRAVDALKQTDLDLVGGSDSAGDLDEIAPAYLAAVEAYLLRRSLERGDSRSPSTWLLMEELARLADSMRRLGYPEASDDALVSQGGILGRILAMKQNRGVGDAVDSAVQVLNALKNLRPPLTSDLSLVLIAYRVFAPPVDPSRKWVTKWIEAVKTEIRSRNLDYLRDGVYDRLLSMLFPEMAKDLKAANLLRPPTAPRVLRTKTWFLGDVQPMSNSASFVLQDTEMEHWWLRGSDLDRWIGTGEGAGREIWRGLCVVP